MARMTTALLIFPHQLFRDHPGLSAQPDRVVLIEDPLFFGDREYPLRFHKQKLWLHRASMQRFAEQLRQEGETVEYIDYIAGEAVTKNAIEALKSQGVTKLLLADPVDFILRKRVESYAETYGLDLDVLDAPLFLNTSDDNHAWRASQKRWFMAEYYKSQRRRLDVLMDGDEPVGGKWSFDEANRKKVPKKLLGSVPQFPMRQASSLERDVKASIETQFPDHYGSLDRIIWPTNHAHAATWLQQFLEARFELFGPYEDAIVEGEALLWHSALTPMLNIGLLTPHQILDAVQDHISRHDVPLNSAEGFIRQIIGWREFMRATYDDLGVQMRTSNHWNHTRDIPE